MLRPHRWAAGRARASKAVLADAEAASAMAKAAFIDAHDNAKTTYEGATKAGRSAAGSEARLSGGEAVIIPFSEALAAVAPDHHLLRITRP